MQPHRIINPVKIRTWAELSRLEQALPGWVYRGQKSAKWRLTSKLERESPTPLLTGLYQTEEARFRTFRSRRPEIVPDPLPEETDLFSWFAAMQHHRESTRLVDFTESIGIAAYFAVAHEEPCSPPEEAAIWAVNTVIFRKMVEDQLTLPDKNKVRFDSDWAGGGLFNFLYGRTRVTGLGAVAARAACMTTRMLRQKGLFVYALNLERTLEDNLYAVYSLPSEVAHKHVNVGFWNGIDAPHIIPKLQKSPVIKILLPPECHDEFKLAISAAGINRQTLFPDPDPAA